MSDVKSVIEALLFVSDTPLTLSRLFDLLPEYEKDAIRSAVSDLRDDYAGANRGICFIEVADGFQFRTRKEYADIIRRLVRSASSRFSKPALETLAIIAYRQPVTRAEIEYLRGVESGGVIKTLLDKNLVKILGKKNIPGKPLIYGTTRRFLEVFSLKDLKSLPTLKEIQELEESSGFEKQVELPLQDKAEIK